MKKYEYEWARYTCMLITNYFYLTLQWTLGFPNVFSSHNVEEAGGDCSLELFKEKTLVEMIYCGI